MLMEQCPLPTRGHLELNTMSLRLSSSPSLSQWAALLSTQISQKPRLQPTGLSFCLPALQSSVCLKYFSAALSLLGCPLGRAARTYSRPHHESLGYTNSFLTSCPSGWRPSHQCSILEPGDLAFLKNASPYF